MPRSYWKVRKIATIAMIAANERYASRLWLATFLATVAILHTFQYGCSIIGKVYICNILETQGISIKVIEAIESVEVNRSRSKWSADQSNQSKSIEVIVEAIKVNQSFKKMSIFDWFWSVSIGYDQLMIILSAIGLNRLRSASID